MIGGRRVVAFTPFGREVTVSILERYLRREHERGLLDEWMLCMNTDPWQHEDVEYAERLARENDWITTWERPGPAGPRGIPAEWRRGFRQPKQMNTGRFYWYMQDRDAVYVRFDDDVVWVHEDALERLVRELLEPDEERLLGRYLPEGRREWLGVFPVIWNNAVSSWWLQQSGVIPMEWGTVRQSAMDPVGWGDPRFAERIHERLFEAIDAGEERLLFGPVWNRGHVLDYRQQFSVSCFAISGAEYADLGGVLDWDEEEHWLTMHRPSIVRRPNVVVGDAHVAHFSFFTQRDYLLTRTDLLDRYRRLSLTVSGARKAGRVRSRA